MSSEITNLAEKLIGKDILEMNYVELSLYNAPSDLDEAKKEIERLRCLVMRMAKNELSESEKRILINN